VGSHDAEHTLCKGHICGEQLQEIRLSASENVHCRCFICSSGGEGIGLCLDCAEREAQEAEDLQSRPLQSQKPGGVSLSKTDPMGPLRGPLADDPIDLEPPDSQISLQMGGHGGAQGGSDCVQASDNAGPSSPLPQGAAWRSSAGMEAAEPAVVQNEFSGEGLWARSEQGNKTAIESLAGSGDLKEKGESRNRRRERAEFPDEVPTEFGEDIREDRRQKKVHRGSGVRVGSREDERPTDTQNFDCAAGGRTAPCARSNQFEQCVL
jgi:hypothetical protein